MITLRPFTPEDEYIMLDILTDSSIKQTYMLPDFNNKQDALPLFRKLLTLSADETHFIRGICLNNSVIGFVNDVKAENKVIELGYVIHPKYQSKGYMSMALGLAICELFTGGYQEVIAGAFAENIASLRVMEHVGMQRMTKTEEIEYRGKIHCCVYYSKKKQE